MRPFRFRIRTLMIAVAATALLAAGLMEAGREWERLTAPPALPAPIQLLMPLPPRPADLPLAPEKPERLFLGTLPDDQRA